MSLLNIKNLLIKYSTAENTLIACLIAIMAMSIEFFGFIPEYSSSPFTFVFGIMWLTRCFCVYNQSILTDGCRAFVTLCAWILTVSSFHGLTHVIKNVFSL